ncbi:hypothetical protein EON67_07330 [archaeon]|nr:MAG: hypothetical protein EON67_07330 [archaeon]
MKLRGALLNPLEVWLASHPLRGGDGVDKPNPAACAHALCQAHAALTAVHDVLRAQLAAVRRRVGFYLGSSVTASVLFKPVRDHMAASLLSAQDVATELASHVPEEDTLFESTGVRGVSVMMAALTALIRAASALLDASDELIVDPTHDMFGCDELVLPAPASAVLPGAAGV